MTWRRILQFVVATAITPFVLVYFLVSWLAHAIEVLVED